MRHLEFLFPQCSPLLDGYSRQAVGGLQLTVPATQQEYEADVSNSFAVTTPYVDDVDDYYLAHGAYLEFSPSSAVDPNAPTTNPPLSQRLQQRRETFDTLPQWTAAPRGVRSASASARLPTHGPGPNGNSPPLAARPGIQSIQPTKHNPQLQPEKHQVDRSDFDEILGAQDDSDAEARMQRLLNQLESVTKADSQNIHEGDWPTSPSTGYGPGAPPPSYENAQRPPMLTRGALVRPLEDAAPLRDPAPLYGVHPRRGGVLGHYNEAESRLWTSDRTLQFPNPPQNTTARSPLPRYKSAPSMPDTIAMSPQPSRSPPRSAATGTDANYASARKPTLQRGRHGGSEQNLHDLSRQNLRVAQPGHGYGHFNSYGNLLNPPITPASPASVPPSLISDSVSRSSSFGSVHTRLVTPTDSTTPVLSGVPHPLGRIDEKSSLDYNEIEATIEYHSPLFQAPSHSSSEAREREKIMEKTLGLKLSTSLPPPSWHTPTSAELPLAHPGHSVMPTPAASVFEGGSTSGSLSLSSGPGGPGGLGGLQRSNSRSGFSDISSYTDGQSRTSAGRTAAMSPSVLAATSFAMNGTMPTGIVRSKAEKAAEKARQKAEKAAKKAEAALLKVEQEREAKAQQGETKRASRQAGDAKKREKDDRQRQAELDLNMPRLMLFST